MKASVPIDVQKFVDQEINKPIRSKIVPLVQSAYDLVDVALNEISFLNWDIGKKHIGYLDNIAVQFTLYEAAKTNYLKGLEAIISPNFNKSSYHIELKTANVVITINRAKNRFTTARKALYRSILQKDNQYFWDFQKNAEILEEPGYLELTHNHYNRKVDFVNIGIPDGKGKWFSSLDLTKEFYTIEALSDENNKTNQITKEKLVKFKNFAQGVQGSGGKD